VVSEVALSLVLLVGAGLMIRSFLKLYNVTEGLRAERFLTLRLSLPDRKYANTDARKQFRDRLAPRLAAIPGVQSAAIVSHLPINGAFVWKLEIEGEPPVEESKRPDLAAVVVDAPYFETVQLGLVRGRGFTETDGLPGKETVVVNQRFAAKYFPHQDPLGKRIRIFWQGDRPWLTVVGVSQDLRQQRPDLPEIEPVAYVPFPARPLSNDALVIRSAVSPTSLTSAVRKEIQAIDGELPVFAVMTLAENFDQQRWQFRVFGSLFAIFAAIALLLSSVGLYAVMAYSVTRRTQEIGLRLAMGASTHNILLLVLKQGLRQLAIGIAIGLLAAFGVARVMKTLLVQISPTDPLTFGAISAVLLAVGIFACWLPARKAMKVDPMVALRYE
jgi:predicted permease